MRKWYSIFVSPFLKRFTHHYEVVHLLAVRLTKVLSLSLYVIDKSYNSGPNNNDGVFQLPSIGKASPFKGFLDISIVTQKLRKNMRSQDGSTVAGGLAPFEFGGAQRGRRGGSKPIKATAEAAGGGSDGEQPNSAVVKSKGTRFQAKDRQVQMSPKVLETWINETL